MVVEIVLLEQAMELLVLQILAVAEEELQVVHLHILELVAMVVQE